jgi:hypothetical protein
VAVVVGTRFAEMRDQRNQQPRVAQGVDDVGLPELPGAETADRLDEPFGGGTVVIGGGIVLEVAALPRLASRIGCSA